MKKNFISGIIIGVTAALAVVAINATIVDVYTTKHTTTNTVTTTVKDNVIVEDNIVATDKKDTYKIGDLTFKKSNVEVELANKLTSCLTANYKAVIAKLNSIGISVEKKSYGYVVNKGDNEYFIFQIINDAVYVSNDSTMNEDHIDSALAVIRDTLVKAKLLAK